MDESKSLNKFIAETGFCSRRQADNYIEEGRVTINGTVARKGNRVMPGDEVLLDGKPLVKKPELLYLALNKPPGVTCTTDLRDPDNIISFLNFPERIFPVGRLDKMSEGLILLTNDGDIVNKILRSRNEHEKEYIVQVNSPITAEFIKKMSSGVPILQTMTKPCFVEKLGTNSFRIILTQGLNRQIRRMCDFLGYHVTKLKRIRIMHIYLQDLPSGKWRALSPEEVALLYEQVQDSEK
jgi:23S rRNA pseudouridine2604 synthase